MSGPAARATIPEGPWDLAVVGGGINGVAVARDAALRGMTVCLFERGDFGSGTSSVSSKMLHGGMRYLEQLHLGLVFEALRERAVQLRQAPHLTTAQTFVIPVYEGARRGPRMIRLGLFLYDLLACGRRLGKGRFLTSEEVLGRVPGLLETGLLGGGLYFDGVMDDARLCLANVLDAEAAAKPAQLAVRSYASVESIRPTAPIELEVRDLVRGTAQRVLAHRVVRVVGPWTDEPRGAPPGAQPLLVPSKGVHVVLPALETSDLGQHGLLLTHASDGRVFFVIPWRGKTLVGTTETPFTGAPEGLRVEQGEVEYLLGELRQLFPGRRFEPADILATYAGVRPLARSSGLFRRGLGSVSRTHRIVESPAGVFTVVGGKYTTYRAVAADVLARVAPGTPSGLTRRRPLAGAELGAWDAARAHCAELVDAFGEDVVRHLYFRYGSRLRDVLALARTDPSLAERLDPSRPELRAEVVHGVRAEHVVYPADFLCRRTDLRLSAGNGRDVYDDVEALIAEHGAARGTVPPDLEEARRRYFDELAHEDGLRATAAHADAAP